MIRVHKSDRNAPEMHLKTAIHKRRVITAALSLSLALSACGGFNGIEEAQYDASRMHPISVDTDVISMMLDIPLDKVALSVSDKAAISAFAATYKQRGHGPLSISAPSGSPNERAAINIVAELRAGLDAVGIPDASLAYAAYRASRENINAPIVLSYSRYVATASPCGNWTMNYGHNPNNINSPNLGCATQNNLAAMLADPADLVTPRDMTPSDANRRSTVLEKYRAGEDTATVKSEEDSGAVSEVNQ